MKMWHKNRKVSVIYHPQEREQNKALWDEKKTTTESVKLIWQVAMSCEEINPVTFWWGYYTWSGRQGISVIDINFIFVDSGTIVYGNVDSFVNKNIWISDSH